MGFRRIALPAGAAVALLGVLPATGGRSGAVAPYGRYAEYQVLVARYYREQRYDDARQAAEVARNEAEHSLAPQRVTRPLASLCAIETAALRYREAAKRCLEARAQAERFGDRDMTALAAFHLSNLYFLLGALDEADAAMARVSDWTGVDPRVLAPSALLHHEARLVARRESAAKALPIFVHAADSAFAAGDTAAAGMIWVSAAREFFAAGDLNEAERLATESFRIRRLLDPAHLSSSQLLLSEIRLRQGRAKEALALAGQAFHDWGSTQKPGYWFYLQRGQALQALGRPAEAIRDIEAAVADIRAQRLAMAPADSFRKGAGVGQTVAFQALADAYADLYGITGARQDAVKGLAAASEGRAYAFRESSGEMARVRERLNQSYFTTLAELRQTEQELFVRDTAAGRERLSQLRLRLTEAELAAGLETPSQAGSLVQFNPSPGEAMLHYSLGPTRSLLWTVAGGRVGLTLLARQEVIEQAAAAFRNGLEIDTRDSKSGQKLYQLLLGKLPAEVLVARRWDIVADGELNQIPFAALEDAAGHYVVENHAVRMIPHAFGGVSEVPWDGPAVAFGDPVYNPADSRVPGRQWVMDPQAPWLPRLPGTAREIQACSRLWGGGARVFTGTEVSLDAIEKSLSERPGLLHFAMHMVPGPPNAAEARLALTVAKDGTPRFLDPATIAALEVRSRLVVLSGCRAGTGASVPGEGIAGLGRAWLLAGAGGVAATLWPIDDDSGEFLQAFYRALGNGTGRSGTAAVGLWAPVPEEALRQAQLTMLRSGTWRAQPRYWAAYFLMGRV